MGFLQHIRDNFGVNTSTLMKKYIHTNIRIAKTVSTRRFLLKCRSNDVTPKHIIALKNRLNNITFHSKSSHYKHQSAISNFSTKILNNEIRDINIHLTFLNNELNTITKKIATSNLDNEVFKKFIELEHNRFQQIQTKLNHVHKKKFTSLLPPINTTSVDKSSWLKNFSDTSLPNNVVDVVSLGPNYSQGSIVSNSDILFTVKNVESVLYNLDVDNSQKDQIRQSVCNIINNNKNKKTHISFNDRLFAKKLNETNTFLKSNNNIFFTRADKGSVTVCLNKSSYFQKMNTLLSDKNIYKHIKWNPLHKFQKNVHNLLKDWNDKEYLNKQFHNFSLTQTNTNIARCYGLPKIHKKDVPLRPIISTINSPTHFLSKILYNQIKNSVNTPKSHINNSFELKTKLQSFTIPDDHILLSLDVTSLFTNIPCHLVLNSLDRRFNSIHNSCKLPFDEIRKCVQFIFNNTFFKFDNKFYQQIFGSPMGSPVSPLFADLVMEDLENDCLDKLNNLGCVPIFYYRYVDDTFLCIKKDYIEIVLDIFNNYDSNLKFTHEIENNGVLNFLDLSVIRVNNRLITNWFQKPTSSGRILNFDSKHTFEQKKNIIYNLVDRSILLSNSVYHRQNIKQIKKILSDNSYPLSFVEKHIKNRLMKIKHNKYNNNINRGSNSNNLYTSQRKICLPFYNNFYKKCSSIFKKYNINVLPKINKNLQSIIKLGKDPLDKFDSTGVVYKFHCFNCPASYVGQTKRSLSTRLKEHMTCKTSDSVVTSHIQVLKHNFDWQNTKILDIEPDYYKRSLSEMLFINSDKNNINLHDDVTKLNRIYCSLSL